MRNVRINQKILDRVESKCWLGKRPVIRRVVMNPVDHPHESGAGSEVFSVYNVSFKCLTYIYI